MSAGTPGAVVGGLGMLQAPDFFQYAVNVTFPTTGLENFTPTIPIQYDAHFQCMATAYSNNAEIGVAANGYVTDSGGAVIQLSDAGTQRFLSNIQVPVLALFGSGREPFIWPQPHLFIANGGISINITGTGAAMIGKQIRLVFIGRKIPINAA